MPILSHSHFELSKGDDIYRESSRFDSIRFDPSRFDLSRFMLFQGCSHSQLAALTPFLRVRQLEADAFALQQGQTCGGLFLLIDGSVKVVLGQQHKTRNQSKSHALSRLVSKEVIAAICGPGEALGEIDLADSSGHTASIVTLEHCTFLWMAGEDFWHCHDLMPRLGRNLSRILAGRLRRATIVHDIQATLQLPGKIAYQLLLLARDYGVVQMDGSILIPLALKQSLLASLVGSSRECVNRVLSCLKKQGCIETSSGGRVRICNETALQNYCEGLAPTPRDDPNGAPGCNAENRRSPSVEAGKVILGPSASKARRISLNKRTVISRKVAKCD